MVKLNDLDLNLFHTFLSFLDSDSMTATAKKLGRSQPAISNRLKQLEESLEVKLFHLVGRKLVLTDEGKLLEVEIRQCLLGMQNAMDKIKAPSDFPTGHLKICTLPTINEYVLSRVIPDLLRDYPTIDISIHFMDSADGKKWLSEGKVDLLVGIGDEPLNNFNVEVSHLIHAVLAYPKKATTGKRQDFISIKDVEKFEYISYGLIDDPFFVAVENLFEKYKYSRLSRLKIRHIDSIKKYIIAGAGVSILPNYTLQEKELAYSKIKEFNQNFALWSACRPSCINYKSIQFIRKKLNALKFLQ